VARNATTNAYQISDLRSQGASGNHRPLAHKNSKHPVQKSNLSVLRHTDYSLKPNLAWLNEPVARRQVGGDVETPLACRTSMAACAAGNAERYTVGVCHDAVRQVRHQHEVVSFDKNLIAGLHVRVCGFQIRNEIGLSIQSLSLRSSGNLF
jgi:hypothetical protein